MRDVLRALNALVTNDVIETYAIGGAVSASFYIDAVQTEDVDAFIFLPETLSGLVDLSRIYAALLAEGGILEGEYIRFGEWPLQVLPDRRRSSLKPSVKQFRRTLREYLSGSFGLSIYAALL